LALGKRIETGEFIVFDMQLLQFEKIHPWEGTFDLIVKSPHSFELGDLTLSHLANILQAVVSE